MGCVQLRYKQYEEKGWNFHKIAIDHALYLAIERTRNPKERHHIDAQLMKQADEAGVGKERTLRTIREINAFMMLPCRESSYRAAT